MKKMYGRFQQKHDTEANWLLATNFAPFEGEVIIYDPDENYDYPRIKIGIWDGTSEKTDDMLVSNLPFVNDIGFDILTNGSIGLKYALYDDHAEFIGLGECTDASVEIASMVQGLYVTAIGDNAFFDCDSLASITIPNSVTSIKGYAFYDCTGLTSITMLSRNPPTIAPSTFGSTTSLEKIFVPKGCGEAYKSATNWAAYADKIEEASIGLNYTLSPDDTTYSVAGLGTCKDTDIIIPPIYEGLPVTSIGKRAFRCCSSLTSITIPESVTSIGDNAFEGCSEITSVAIPDSVESIGADAFGGCSALKSIAIPAGVTRIGNYPFWGCPGIKSITVNSQNTVYHSAGNCLIETASKTLIQGCQNSVIPDDGSVTSIGDDAFDDCTYLKSIVIPKSVTSIGRWAFKNCVELTDITIPDSVTSIGQSAFKNCTKLSSAIIGNGVTSIGDWAFSLCPALTSVTIGNNVTSIGLGAFFNCSGLTSVTIPDSVTSIGDNAFNGCSSLANVTIGNSVTSIGDWAFGSCVNLTDVYYTGTEEQWNAITIGANGTYLTNATIHYNWEG